MPSKFSLHSDPDELLQIQNSLPTHPKYLFLRQAIRIELDRLFPSTELRLYSYQTDWTTFWFPWKINRHALNHACLCYEGDFNEERFAEALTMFVKATDAFSAPLLIVSEKRLFVEVERFVTVHVPEVYGVPDPTQMFCMTEAQMEMVERLPLPSLPEGYILGSASAAVDAELITSHWIHAKEGEVEETRAKLTNFPSSCIRHDGKPVAFEMVSQAGILSALYVMEEHRGKGFGRIVELDLCQKMIRSGLNIIKCVELFNKSLLDSTCRLHYWTKVKNDDGSDLIIVYYEPK